MANPYANEHTQDLRLNLRNICCPVEKFTHAAIFPARYRIGRLIEFDDIRLLYLTLLHRTPSV